MSLKVFAAWLFVGLMAVTGAQAETLFRLPGSEDSFFWIKMDGLSTRM